MDASHLISREGSDKQTVKAKVSRGHSKSEMKLKTASESMFGIVLTGECTDHEREVEARFVQLIERFYDPTAGQVTSFTCKRD